jgi:hypothetical protein
VANSVTSFEICDDDTADGFTTFYLTNKNAEVLGNQASADFVVTYHNSQTDADAASNPLSVNYTNVSNPEMIFIRVEELSSGNFDTTAFELIVLSVPAITTPSPLQVCDFDNDGFNFFDITSADIEITGGNTDLVVTYHETLTDAETSVNSLVSPYGNIVSNMQTLYVRVENISSNCVAYTELLLLVSPTPEVANPMPYETCDDNGDGFETFDLTTKNEEILNSLDPSQHAVTFYLTEIDAVSGTNSLANPDNFINSVMSIQTVWVRVENFNTGCSSAVPLILIVSPCEGIEVNAFLDSNNDGVFNNNEARFTNNGYFTYEVNNDGTINTVNTSTGEFTIPYTDDTNVYDITFSLDADYNTCYSVSPSIFENVNVTSGNIVTIDFPVTVAMPCEDVAVYLVPNSSPRPGFNYYNTLVIENIGTANIVSGSLEFTKDALSDYIGISNIPTGVILTTTATGFTADFTNLESGNSIELYIQMYIPATVGLGELLTNSATYITTTNDVNSSNDESNLSQTVIGSYDPNDIAESHGPEIVYEDFVTTDEYLYYTIRFQNVGTAEAINVRIENTVDAILDISTLQLLKSSHDVVMTQTDSQLTWAYDDINLPAESQDAEGSNGYVYYRIKPTAGYAIGTMIPNTAEIYFDFNAAVITNTFTTEFVAPVLSVEEFELNNTTFTLFPNPADHTVNITLPSTLSEDANIIVYNILGKRLMTKVFEKNTLDLQLNVENLQSGLYFVNLKTNTNETIKRLVVK